MVPRVIALPERLLGVHGRHVRSALGSVEETGTPTAPLTMGDQDRDVSCLDRLRAGDHRALEELYDRHNPLLYSLVLRIVRQVPDAEEVLQEIWVQAWKLAGAYDPARGSVGAWLVTLARSRAIDRYRSMASRQRAETGGEPDPPRMLDEPAGRAAQSQLRERVNAALAGLAPQQRLSLELAYFSGLSQSEIALHLGAPLGTVKSWIRQGLSRLRELVPREDWT
jgi:RNA polymerase sigma-70 factor (ECF subfamily)